MKNPKAIEVAPMMDMYLKITSALPEAPGKMRMTLGPRKGLGTTKLNTVMTSGPAAMDVKAVG